MKSFIVHVNNLMDKPRVALLVRQIGLQVAIDLSALVHCICCQ